VTWRLIYRDLHIIDYTLCGILTAGGKAGKKQTSKMEEISIIQKKDKILNKPQELLMFLPVIFLQGVWKIWLACILFSSFFNPHLFLKRQN
jgi:hypothetical protein